MLKITLDEANLLAILEPDGKLAADDFQSIATEVDPLIEKAGKLNGLLIHAEAFPGWDSFAAFCSHMSFVKNHHRQIARVALVTDSSAGSFAENVASHFVKAEIKVFPYAELTTAKDWILEGASD